VKFERLLETYLAFAPRGFRSFRMALPLWIKEKLFQKDLLGRRLRSCAPDFDWQQKLLFAEHHQSHAASAFYPSPFEEALILTMDGVGEWATTSVGIGLNHSIDMLKEIHFPHSLGLLYAAFTHYTGFKVNSGEYKVMGLAPYGEPRYINAILEHLVDLKPDGSFHLNQEYFDYCVGLRMTNGKFDRLFGGPPRAPDAPLEQRHMDLAASIQAVTNEAILRMIRSLVAETGIRKLCLAGGVALNCVANGEVFRDGAIDALWVQPAAGDAGGALGAALAAYYEFLDQPRRLRNALDEMQGAYLGPSFTTAEIAQRLRSAGAVLRIVEGEDALMEQTVDALTEQKAVGWFQGRMEFGPRALGARSILGDPRSPDMQRQLNLKVKFRESFRPFAPSVLREDVAEWFELDEDSPYMLALRMSARIGSALCARKTKRFLGSTGFTQFARKFRRLPMSTCRRAFRRFTGRRTRAITRCSRLSRRVRAVRSSSIPVSTSGASPLSVPRKTRSAVSWEPTSNSWLPVTVLPARKIKIRYFASITRECSSRIDRPGRVI
jgi:carbamoyltransferase